ncbi:hypothetical protein JXA40_03770 [bacterium]|nr:hypothetical protein [candidate division CSSED10-310 bacterium]
MSIRKPKNNQRTEFEEYSDEELKALDTSCGAKLTINTISVILTNTVPLYGVLFKHWSSFTLIVMFVMEGVIVLGTDFIKLPFRKSTLFIEKNMRNSGSQIMVFEVVFILFFGAFALIAFGPRTSSHLVLSETFVPVINLIFSDLKWPFLLVLGFRLQRTFQDFFSAGAFGKDASYPLSLNGGGWMLLLFFVVILVPILSPGESNPFAGLVTLVCLKTLGEIFGVWAIKIALKIPDNKKQPDH